MRNRGWPTGVLAWVVKRQQEMYKMVASRPTFDMIFVIIHLLTSNTKGNEHLFPISFSSLGLS